MSRCLNPDDHQPHQYLADLDAVAMTDCPGGPRTYTAAEVAEYQYREARYVLETLQAALESVQAQRRASFLAGRYPVSAVRAQGEVIGLQIAIEAIKRRLR